ncbi:MAG: glycosyltransferase family 4 protein [Acidimicrobiia bacterium]|nr:glycosyltransferase family 4 protein [Acidimicrobiia bacterium]MDH5521818.1 glycosyltransferase family 4 protein [Acidimicrobiia bacterium]
MTADVGSRRHLLVTNDFPPKVGGIQNYLWELWRRLPPEQSTVYTTPYPGSDAFDAGQRFAVHRCPEPFLIPYPWLPRRIDGLARRTDSELVILDPAIPLGAIGPGLEQPTAVILHGAEVTIPGRVPILRSVMARTLRASSLVIAAGRYPLAEAERCAGRTLPSVVIPPGVDTERFTPLDEDRRRAVRTRWGVSGDDFLIASVNRLVPRKGMDRLIDAVALVGDREVAGPARNGSGRVRAVVAGRGRESGRLQRRVDRLRVPVQLPGRLSDDDVADLYGAADLMVMPCNSRWFGLEQEGFGIAFLEAAAAGVAQIAGRSGGAHEAVEHGVTGLVLDDPDDVRALATAIGRLIDRPDERTCMGHAARRRAVDQFDYDKLALRLARALDDCELITSDSRS